MDRLDEIVAALAQFDPRYTPTPEAHRDQLRRTVSAAVAQGLPSATARTLSRTWTSPTS